jgi:hypothetical protein
MVTLTSQASEHGCFTGYLLDLVCCLHAVLCIERSETLHEKRGTVLAKPHPYCPLSCSLCTNACDFPCLAAHMPAWPAFKRDPFWSEALTQRRRA